MKKLNRRTFIKEATVMSAGLASIGSPDRGVSKSVMKSETENSIPMRSIGKHKISRLIIGGNPFYGGAHAEPLVYGRSLFIHYFTNDKVAETLSIAVKNGINTYLGRVDDRNIGQLKYYEKVSGKMIPWIAQTAEKPHQGATKQQIEDNIKRAIDNGAIAVYYMGQSCDYHVKQGEVGEIAYYLDFIRKLGVAAGAGAHEISTIEAIEKAGIVPDFYMKTYNSLEYCCPNFKRVQEFMDMVKVPWIAFKILAAGRMKPEEGFAAALKSNASFFCVGMFDFQIEEDVKLFKSLV